MSKTSNFHKINLAFLDQAEYYLNQENYYYPSSEFCLKADGNLTLIKSSSYAVLVEKYT